MYFDRLKEEFTRRGYKMFPMTESEIDELTQKYGKLPAAYTELLRLLGSGTTASFWRGTEFFRKDILFESLNEWAQETLDENSSKATLKNDDYVFWMSQGVLFCYFGLNDGDDPPVYLFTEATPDRFIRVSNSFTEFIWNYCFDQSKAFEEIS